MSARETLSTVVAVLRVLAPVLAVVLAVVSLVRALP